MNVKLNGIVLVSAGRCKVISISRYARQLVIISADMCGCSILSVVGVSSSVLSIYWGVSVTSVCELWLISCLAAIQFLFKIAISKEFAG